jgi:glycosyltransferase involved in cell wall biosynthesis
MIVSVVIPTVLRKSLISAIESARSQSSEVTVEIIVVVDKDESAVRDADPALAIDADVILFTGGQKGAPAARNLGVAAASGDWIAFLDDDDEWEATKLRDQLAAVSHLEADKFVISGQVRQRSEHGQVSRPIPDKTYEPVESVADYLFLRRKASLGRESIFTSTLLVTGSLAKAITWDESLKRHQDWDWLLKAEAAEARIIQIASPVSVQAVGSPASISASSDWRSSLSWCRQWRSTWGKRTYVDFIVAQPMRYALQARSVSGVTHCLREIISAARLPTIGPLLIGGAGILPRKKMETLMLSKTIKRVDTSA